MTAMEHLVLGALAGFVFCALLGLAGYKLAGRRTRLDDLEARIDRGKWDWFRFKRSAAASAIVEQMREQEIRLPTTGMQGSTGRDGT